jgi:DNA helicase-2/ATP-dependent DNA helicase PcrA
MSRFLREIPPELIVRQESTGFASHFDEDDGARSTTWRARGSAAYPGSKPPRVRDSDSQVSHWRDEDEDQSPGGLRPGTKVRHAQFGVGTVLSVEGSQDTLKVLVRFASVGQKKLMARFARLEPA